MKKNKLLVIALAILMTVSLVAGCAAPAAPAETPAAETKAPATEAPAETKAPAAETEAPTTEAPAEADSDFTVLSSTKGMDNEYYAELNRGGEEYAKQMGFEYVTLSSEDNEQKQIADLESGLVTYEPDFVIIMPTSSSIVPALADLCEAAKVPFVTLWDYPEGFDFTPYEYHLAHILTDMELEGYTMATYLFEAMGGKGNIVAIDGLLGSTTAVERHKGLERALKENPDIKLLESQPGNWNRFDAAPVFEDMFIKYGDEINGVWTANDDMALGVYEILAGADKVGGKIPIVGLDCLSDVLKLIEKGEYVMSMSGDAPGMQALAMSIGYDFVKGGIRPETDERRFIMYAPPIITKENAAEYYELWYGESAKTRDWTVDSKLLSKEA